MLSRLRAGSESAARDFYRAYSGFLYALCCRYVADDDAAKDVLQDCIIKILDGIGRFEYRGPGSLLAWAKRIAVNVSISYLRRRPPEEPLESWQDVAEEEPDVSAVPAELIHRMIRELPQGYRMVFNLFVLEGKSHKEIASMLGIKEDSSASQFHRAKALLAKKLKEYIGS